MPPAVPLPFPTPLPAPGPVPVLTLASIDPLLRDSTAATLICDDPRALVIRYDLDDPHGPDPRPWRTVYTTGGVLEQAEVNPGHGCLTCAIREDLLGTAHRLSATGPTRIVLALPPTLEPLPLVRALRGYGGPLAAAAVLTAADGATFTEDLLGAATLTERGLAQNPDEERPVAEALTHQVEYSDVVAFPEPPPATAARLLAHLGHPGLPIHPHLAHALDADALAGLRRPSADPRGDLQAVAGTETDDGDGIRTLALTAARPLHPDRLLERIEDLGRGPVRARGHLWLASRPDSACAWDGAGNQVSIGSLGPWTRRRAGTRLLVTGTDRTALDRIRDTFAELPLTAQEHARGADWWSGHGDALGPWLGVPDDLDEHAH
jgi:G3E family GTPase